MISCFSLGTSIGLFLALSLKKCPLLILPLLFFCLLLTCLLILRKKFMKKKQLKKLAWWCHTLAIPFILFPILPLGDLRWLFFIVSFSLVIFSIYLSLSEKQSKTK